MERTNSISRSVTTADELRAHISRGLILPGEHLGQAELAERFNMSKVPVREALKQLCAEGLLRHDHNRGYFVAALSYEEGVQLYRMRRWIESELLKTARWPDKTELEQFEAKVDRVSLPGAAANRQQWLADLLDLRRSIFDLSPEKLLLREAMRLWSLTDRYRAALPPQKTPTGERALLVALAKRNRDALLKAYHIERDRIEAALEDIFDR